MLGATAEADAHVAAGGEEVRERALDEGHVLGGGQLSDGEGLLEMADLDLADGSLLERQPDVPETGDSGREVVLRLEADVAVERPFDEEPGATKLGAVDEEVAAVVGYENLVGGGDEGEVGLNPTADLDLEGAVLRLDPSPVLPVDVPRIFRIGLSEERKGERGTDQQQGG